VVVGSHREARSAAVEFSKFGSRPSLLLAAGGGGTLRAVVEGVMDAFPSAPPTAEVLRLAALRMGSGNVVAGRLGMPIDPVAAARQVGEGVAGSITAPSGAIRLTHRQPHGGTAP